MFQQQEKVLIDTVNSASLVTKQRINKLSSDIIVNSEKLIKLADDVSDVKLSTEVSQEMMEEKVKKLKRELIQKNKKTWDIIEDESKG